MARLQILELPEGTGDDRPPFVLVISEAPTGPDGLPLISHRERRDTADLIGARAVLVFEDTIDIPANDTSAFAQPLTTALRTLDQKRDETGPVHG